MPQIISILTYLISEDNTNMSDASRTVYNGIDFGCHSVYAGTINANSPDMALSSLTVFLNCHQKERRIL